MLITHSKQDYVAIDSGGNFTEARLSQFYIKRPFYSRASLPGMLLSLLRICYMRPYRLYIWKKARYAHYPAEEKL